MSNFYAKLEKPFADDTMEMANLAKIQPLYARNTYKYKAITNMYITTVLLFVIHIEIWIFTLKVNLVII